MAPGDAGLDAAAHSLAGWFGDVLDLGDRIVATVAVDEPHRVAAWQSMLTSNARNLAEHPLDPSGELYPPACLVLAAACRRLAMSPAPDHWRSAIVGVGRLRAQLDGGAERLGIPLGSAGAVFRNLFVEALANAGVSGRPTILVEENRRTALALSINWGLRFLIAYAMECGSAAADRTAGVRGLSWIGRTVAPVIERA